MKSHIFQPLLISRLKLLAVGLITALSCLLVNPITAHADELDSIVNDIVTQYNGTSSSTRGGNNRIQNGVAYTRTGYLCYLLTKDGATTGDPAYAFQSPGYNGIAGSKWVCTSRRGHSVSSWKATAPWGVTPWQELGTASNEPKIKEWMLQPIDGAPMAYAFVKECWGAQAAQSFQSDEYILVIETIMNFQYSVKGGDGGNSGGGTIDPATRISVIATCQTKAEEYVERMSEKTLQKILSNSDRFDEEGIETKEDYQNYITRKLITRVLAQLEEESSTEGAGRTFTSDPLIGTVPNLIQYKNGNTVFNSYTNKVAPHAEKIKVSEAGFTAYTGSGSTQLSDSEVQSYGVAMLIIHCKNDSIHTYWEPNGSPGDPEPRLPGKTGTCNIVKGYYKENLTTGAKESLGVYHELDVTSKIIVSGEPEFELVEWRVTNTTSTGVNPISWNPPGSTSQQGKSGATLTLKDPEECVYVLLKQVEIEEEEPIDYNYLIPQSSITRRIWFSKPDHQLSMEKIQEHEFIWVIPAHDPYECEGHTYTTSGDHDDDCDDDCTDCGFNVENTFYTSS